MLKILIYNELKVPETLKTQTERVLDALQNGDFRAADVKKMAGTNGFYRAKLDDKNRLLFKIGRYEGLSYLLVMDLILNHDYDKSRFLNGRGGQVDENKWQPIAPADIDSEKEFAEIAFVNERQRHFHLLDKFLSFDEAQEEVFSAQPPLIAIGSAGSGKTALTLEKIKRLSGHILYVTLSPFLVENARRIYFMDGYENEAQSVDFLSFTDFVRTISMPQGKEMDYRSFNQWAARHKQAFHIKDTHKIFEEFRGVLSGNAVDRAHLSLEDYMALGVRDSVFTAEERPKIYQFFQKYLAFLKEGKFYDINLVSFSLLEKIGPHYDFVVVDEVQDFTNVQLTLILKSLNTPGQFMLCGDSNQIVHPNFFSWKSVKSMFYKSDLEGDIIRILTTNYRNSPEVTRVANHLLLLKNLRFGSIDRESTYLINANNSHSGKTHFFWDKPEVLQELNRATGRSTNFAVIVMRNEDKEAAQKLFSTPLIFSVKEAKGLEYRNIILFNMISQHEKEFRDICEGVLPEDLEGELIYARAKDKTDRSLETYKFYINSLYVAITRAIDNLFVVEHADRPGLWKLIGQADFQTELNIEIQASSIEDWQREANRLEKQGKLEQADEIKKQVLREQPVPWEVITLEKYEEIKARAFTKDHYDLKAKEKVFEYTSWYHLPYTHMFLSSFGYRRKSGVLMTRKNFIFNALPNYNRDNPALIQKHINQYGVDYRSEFNYTPLMMAAEAGAVKIAEYLIKLGADRHKCDNYGRTPFMIMLQNAYFDPKYGKEKFPKLYPILCPDYFKYGMMGKMGIVDTRSADFFVIALACVMYRFSLIQKVQEEIPCFNIDVFVLVAKYLPDSIMPAYRKKKSYILSLFAKNETFRMRNNSYRAFYRVGRGKYTLSPAFEVFCNDALVNVCLQQIMEDDPERDLLQDYIPKLASDFARKIEGIKTNNGNTNLDEEDAEENEMLEELELENEA